MNGWKKKTPSVKSKYSPEKLEKAFKESSRKESSPPMKARDISNA